MSRAGAIHVDATQPGSVLRRALCGWLQVDTETDITKVTCKACRKVVAGKAKPAKERTPKSKAAAELDAEYKRVMAPKAPPPPRLDPATWAACCRASHGTNVRRCGDCTQCVWERKEANLWGSREVAAHNRQHQVARLPNAPRWPNINKALVAYAEYHAHERFAKSATGGIIDRIKRGADADGGVSRPDDPMQRAADDIVAVEQALHLAYPEGAHQLAQQQRIQLLLVRTPGVAPVKVVAGEQVPTVLPTYEALAEALSVSSHELQALVNNGRGRAALSLFARGMIPMPRERRRDKGEGNRAFAGEQPQEGAACP